MEVEQYVDLTPTKALSATAGKAVWYAATQMQTEFEYGITNRLELGLYVTFVPQPGDNLASTPVMTEGNGIKQRLKLRLADEGSWPIDISLYGEVSENEREIELEGKIILQKRLFDKLRIAANAWVEREFYYDGRAEWVVNPTAGVTYQATPIFHPGIEWWLRAELPGGDGPRGFNLGPHQYLGPTVLLSFGKLWWSSGAYLRLTDATHTLVPGEAFGKVWVRTVVGFGF